MYTLFSSIDSIIDLPYAAFQKKLAQYEEEFKNIDVRDISDDELESFYTRIRTEYEIASDDKAKNRLAILGYIAHFDVLVEKFFPDYVALFQGTLQRPDSAELAEINQEYLEHLEEILRDYSHRMSEPDQHASYTGYIQELIQQNMIDLFFWLQEREISQEEHAKAEDKHTDFALRTSEETDNIYLKWTRRALEFLSTGILEKIFFDLGYTHRVSPVDRELHLIGRYNKKNA
jgi:hypothetical protein